MVISFVKTLVCFYLCSSVVDSYQVTQQIPSYSHRDRTKSKYVAKTAGQAKYPNFNKIMTRIENLNDEVTNKQTYHKIRHKGWNKLTTSTTTTTTETSLFETYGDLEDDDYLDNYDELEDEEDDLDYEEDDDDEFDTFEDIQAEEPTETPTTPLSRPVSRLTEYKWQHYGTMERVQESRRQQLNLRPSKEQQKVRAALEHYARVLNQSKCLKPSPKVIPVQQEYPDPSKTYTPHCTVLHRCAEDTGCCKRNTRCHYKSRMVVHLYFYTQTLESSETKVEKLAFYNHTECECREKADLSSENATGTSDITFRAAPVFYALNTLPPKNDRCRCPKEFRRSMLVTHKCACDCEDNNDDCVQLKKGKEHFSMTDRICLQDGQCGLPICEYGSYSSNEGKCPTKKDKLDEFRKVRITY